jgi:hypothetical protein
MPLSEAQVIKQCHQTGGWLTLVYSLYILKEHMTCLKMQISRTCAFSTMMILSVSIQSLDLGQKVLLNR